MKKALMITAIIGIVFIVGAIIYYFAFFKPGIERDELKLQEQKFELEQKEKQEKSKEEATKKDNLDKCLKEADNFRSDLINKALEAVKEDPSLGEGLSEAIDWIDKKYQDRIDNCYRQYGD